ncbi:hypothetical protein GG804_27050 [Sphingomonas histidinilytica]|uniref:hypothetical protein n=1 Tax=Rhizorhabdus histidinilytica TaxID=439228 RepID=UPI001ADAB041|nr:hypothetical protein [Rhizorhabdus histidinilytica]MBO9380426.1 hypothetical protein [Rhizorhabdus histidinilytica]
MPDNVTREAIQAIIDALCRSGVIADEKPVREICSRLEMLIPEWADRGRTDEVAWLRNLVAGIEHDRGLE